MRDFIYRIVDLFPSPLRGPARAVADVTFGVWDDIFRVFVYIGQAWGVLWTGAHEFVWAMHAFGLNVTTALRDIVVRRIPQWATSAVSAAVQWAQDRVAWLHGLIQSGLSTLKSWAERGINAARALAQDFLKWTVDRVASITDAVRWLIDRVDGVLGTPARLVEWILPTLVTRLSSWVDSNVDVIAQRMWMARERIFLATLGRLEALIARLL